MPHCMIVISPYYEEIAEHLLSGAKSVLEENHKTYEIIEVPGALEIPTAIKYGILRPESRGTKAPKFDAFIALGCIIRGETAHYDIVCNESARGLLQLSLEHGAAIGNGILTCDTKAQATVRADPAQKNKGAHAANAALSLFKLKRSYQIQ